MKVKLSPNEEHGGFNVATLSGSIIGHFSDEETAIAFAVLVDPQFNYKKKERQT